MACPCFYPVESLLPSAGRKIAPLGDIWTGLCRATPAADGFPDPATTQELCNFGYAKEKCPRFPAGDPDAVRFTVSGDQDGRIRIYWVMEKNHLPFAHGPLEYSRAENAFVTNGIDERLAQQARAYVTSYLRRKVDRRG
jgi:hypothetical protein